MKSTRKGNNWHFGMKVHVGTDLQGRVHHVKVTDASVHDSQVMDELLHGDEQSIYGDKAYANDEKAADARASNIDWRVSRKARKNRKLNCGGIVKFAIVGFTKILARHLHYWHSLICICVDENYEN